MLNYAYYDNLECNIMLTITDSMQKHITYDSHLQDHGGRKSLKGRNYWS